MEQKINALKTASKVISVITKIGHVASVVMVCICAALLIFLAVTGGNISTLTIFGVNVIIFDAATYQPAELAAICAVLIVMGAILFAIFLLAHRMFKEISLTGKPFEDKYVKNVRQIGILTAAMPIIVGIAESIATAITKTNISQMHTDLPGVIVGAIIYCLSYIIDYGCAIKKQSAEEETADAAQEA